MAIRSPLGQQVHLALVQRGPQAAVTVARDAGQPNLFDRVSAVAGETPSPRFLHSALCAMSLPVRRLPRINPKRPAAISSPQLAVHFGNDSRNIRKFRQTVRDAWERQVSAVYPEAKADFDTTVIRLFASPAPLQQKLIPGAHLRLASDDKQPPSSDATTVSSRFMTALSEALGPAEARAWLKGDARLENIEGTWVLQTKTSFIAHWISTRFDLALRRAAVVAEPPSVQARRSVP